MELRLDETEVIRRLRSGDEAAFAGLVGAHHTALVRFAMLFVADRSIAEEIVQDAWMAVVTGVEAFEGRAAIKSWIFSIVANKAKTRGVREKRTVAFSDLTVGGDDAAVDPERFGSNGGWLTPPGRWDGDTPERNLLRAETLAVARQAMAALPANQRAVVTLRDVEGLDAAEVCNVLELSETNQRVLLHRGRAKVRAALERHLAEGRSC